MATDAADVEVAGGVGAGGDGCREDGALDEGGREGGRDVGEEEWEVSEGGRGGGDEEEEGRGGRRGRLASRIGFLFLHHLHLVVVFVFPLFLPSFLFLLTSNLSTGLNDSPFPWSPCRT